MKYIFEGYIEYAPKNDREWHFERKQFYREVGAKTRERAEKKLEIILISQVPVPVKRVSYEYTCKVSDEKE